MIRLRELFISETDFITNILKAKKNENKIYNYYLFSFNNNFVM